MNGTMTSEQHCLPRRVLPLRKKCPYSELFWLASSRIWIEYQSVFSPNAKLTLNMDTFHAVCTNQTGVLTIVISLKHFKYFEYLG